MKKKYWFYLEPFVYVNIQKDHLLIYNTLNGTAIEETNEEIIELIEKLTEYQQLYVTELSEQELQKAPITNFIKQIRYNFMGDIIDQTLVSGKPVQIPPNVKIMEKKREGDADKAGYNRINLMENLSHMTFFLNNSNTGFSNFPGEAYRQFLAPAFAGDNPQELPLEPLLQFLAETKTSPLERINLLGGNIFTYPQLPHLVKELNKRKALKAYYAHYSQVAKCHLEELSLEGELHIIVNFPEKGDELAHCIQALKPTKIPVHFHFVVASEDHLEQADRIILQFDIADYDYMPFHDGNNLNFFKEAVFIDTEDILEEQPNMRKILMRTKVNPLHYGHLTINSNGHIHTNINDPKVGVLGVDSLHEVLFTAIHEKGSWGRTRGQVAPCNQCVFQNLCPPLSNYEYVMQRNNLCHIQD